MEFGTMLKKRTEKIKRKRSLTFVSDLFLEESEH